jgi:hypothetical protein
MKKIALLALAAIALSTPSMAKTHRHHHFYREASRHRVDYRETSRHHFDYREASRRRVDYRETSGHHFEYRETIGRRLDGESPAGTHPQITCEMVRAYVAQVGLVQAKALAVSAGITASEERRAIRCLEKKI